MVVIRADGNVGTTVLQCDIGAQARRWVHPGGAAAQPRLRTEHRHS
jgi:hypothetical protein